jgi:hypothetical protein
MKSTHAGKTAVPADMLPAGDTRNVIGAAAGSGAWLTDGIKAVDRDRDRGAPWGRHVLADPLHHQSMSGPS